MTTILAIDQSTTQSGWCFGGSSIALPEWKSGKFRAPKRDEDGERLIIIHDSILELIDRFNPDILVYESTVNPTVHAIRNAKAGKPINTKFNAKIMEALQRVKGAVMMAAARRGIQTEEYGATSWHTSFSIPSRKPAGAPDNWKKKIVQARLKAMGINSQSLDESDAIGLCFYALHGRPGVHRATGDLLARVSADL